MQKGRLGNANPQRRESRAMASVLVVPPAAISVSAVA